MGDATLHRHGDTIPGPDGPPIVPFPRKHLALSAPGGALVLSPLETLSRGRGTRIKQEPNRVARSKAERAGVEIRRFGFASRRVMDFLVRGRSSGRNRFSAAGRRLPDLVGSA